jgi:hypothetical protein
MRLRFIDGVVLIALILVAVSSAQAQPLSDDNLNRNSLNFSYFRPYVMSQYAFWESFTTLDIATAKDFKVKIVVPYSHITHYDEFGYYNSGYSESATGNIYLGLEGVKRNSRLFYECGLSLPTSDEEAWAFSYGTITDISRMEAYGNDLTVFKGSIGFRSQNTDGLVKLFKIGPSIWHMSSNSSGSDSDEFFINYSAQFWYYANVWDIGFGVTGTGILSEDQILYQNRFLNRFEVGMGFRAGHFRPGCNLYLPLSHELEVTNYVLGINMTAYFGE